jgi:hypothetical protein
MESLELIPTSGIEDANTEGVFPFKIFQQSVNEYSSSAKIWVGWKVLSILIISIVILSAVARNLWIWLKMGGNNTVYSTKIMLYLMVWFLLWFFTATL